MAFNLQQTVKPRLAEGVYNATLINWEDSSDTKGDRLTLEFQFPDRIIKQVVFPTSLNFWIAGFAQQLDIQTEISQLDLLNEALNKPLQLHVSYNDSYVNFSPFAPRPVTPSTPTIEVDEAF